MIRGSTEIGENLLGTECIIRNIAATFSENKRLGMLVPPVPDYGIIFEKRADGLAELI